MKKEQSGINWKIGGGALGLLILFAILVAVNGILGNLRLRVDLTEENLYTLSKGSKSILKDLEEPVTLKLFFNSTSAEVPVYLKNHARQVEDLLHEYRVAGRGNITVEKYDPKPDSDAEEWAQRYGISGQPVGMFGPPVYFGLVAVAGDTEGAIPALDPRQEALLEYNVTRLIYRVTHPEKPKVGVLSSLPVLGRQGGQMQMPGMPPQGNVPAWISFQELGRDYQVEELPADSEEIPSDLKALMVVHPKNLSDKTLYAIDQFVLAGGHLMVFVDPMSFADMQGQPQQNPMMQMRQQVSSSLPKLFEAWGVTFDEQKVIADRRAVSVMGGRNGAVEDPTVLSLTKANLSSEDIVTTQLETMMMAYVGAFTVGSASGLTATPLVTTSTNSCLVSAMSARFGPQAIRSEIKSTGVEYNLALRLSGNFKTAFPDGKPDGADSTEGEEKATDGSLKEGESSIILVGDVDLLFNPVCVQQMNFLGTTVNQPRNDNLNFFGNATEQVAGSSDLIGIRSRGQFNRPFTKVLELEAQARGEWKKQENDLVEKLQTLQNDLNKLKAEQGGNQTIILTPEQKKKSDDFKRDEIDTKLKLREVRKNLRRDIEVLGVKLKVLNIGLMPLLVAIVGIGYGLFRRLS